MSRNTWIIFAVATVAVLAGLVYISSQNQSGPDVSDIDQFGIVRAESSDEIGDHVYGNPGSEVVLIEYADFQCGSCAATFPQIESIIEEYGDHIAIVTRNFAFLQPHGMAASSAVEAAGIQGKHKDMARVLYANQASWAVLSAADRDSRFTEYANNLGLDVDKFNADRASDKVKNKISLDKALGTASNVTGTPAFFLNGQAVDGQVRVDEDAFRDLIDAAIRDKGGTPPERASQSQSEELSEEPAEEPAENQE